MLSTEESLELALCLLQFDVNEPKRGIYWKYTDLAFILHDTSIKSTLESLAKTHYEEQCRSKLLFYKNKKLFANEYRLYQIALRYLTNEKEEKEEKMKSYIVPSVHSI